MRNLCLTAILVVSSPGIILADEFCPTGVYAQLNGVYWYHSYNKSFFCINAMAPSNDGTLASTDCVTCDPSIISIIRGASPNGLAEYTPYGDPRQPGRASRHIEDEERRMKARISTNGGPRLSTWRDRLIKGSVTVDDTTTVRWFRVISVHVRDGVGFTQRVHFGMEVDPSILGTEGRDYNAGDKLADFESYTPSDESTKYRGKIVYDRNGAFSKTMLVLLKTD